MSAPVGYPLTRQQSALVEQGGQGRTVRTVVRLPLAAAAARAALEAEVARHEVLRSTLQKEAALRTGLQLVHEVPSTLWTELASGADPHAVADDLASRLDPATGPVLAVALGPDETGEGSVVVACGSALFTDLRTLTELAAQAAGRADAVEDPIQYTEYGAWQAEMLEDTGSEDTAAAAAAWSRLFDDEVRTVLPVAEGAAEGAAEGSTVLEAPEGAHGEPVARWLALWTVAVARLTGEPTVTLGVELDPTDNPELAGAAGPFARLVPLTLEVPVHGSFSVFAEKVEQSLAQARTWFEWSPAATDVAVLFSVGPLGSHIDRAAFQVELRVAPDGGQAVVLAGADGSLTQARAVGIGLGRLLAQDTDRLEDLDVLSADAVERLLGAYSPPTTGIPVVTRLAEHAAAAPDRTALTDGTTSVSYADLVARVDGLAGALLEASGGSGAPVAVHLPRSVDAVVAMLAAQRAGLGYLPLDVDGPPERSLRQAGIAGAAVLVSDRAAPAGYFETVSTLQLRLSARCPTRPRATSATSCSPPARRASLRASRSARTTSPRTPTRWCRSSRPLPAAPVATWYGRW